MWKFSSSLLGVSTLVCMGFTAGNSPDPLQIYDSGAEKVRQVLGGLNGNSQMGHPPRRTYRLSQAEINAYLLDELRQQEKSVVESVSVLFRDGEFVTMIGFDPERLQLGEDTMARGLLGLLFEGTQTLEIEGQLRVNNGSGRYQIERVRFSGLALPIELVNEILISLGKGQDPPFDPTSSFPMPYGIRSVIFSPGQVIIET